VVFELASLEVASEAAPASRGDTVMAEDRQRKQHEMAANADQNVFRAVGRYEADDRPSTIFSSVRRWLSARRGSGRT
jgi:hypothetical protein